MVEGRVVKVERLKFFANAMLIKSLCSATAFGGCLRYGTMFCWTLGYERIIWPLGISS